MNEPSEMSDSDLSVLVARKSAHEALDVLVAADDPVAMSQAMAELCRVIAAAVVVRRAAIVLVLALALPIAAREVVCNPPGNSRFPCSPPATFVLKSAVAQPMDAPVRFGGAIVIQGRTFWLWIKAGEPSKPCTPQQVFGSFRRECSRNIGDVLYITSAFRVEP